MNRSGYIARTLAAPVAPAGTTPRATSGVTSGPQTPPTTTPAPADPAVAAASTPGSGNVAPTPPAVAARIAVSSKREFHRSNVSSNGHGAGAVEGASFETSLGPSLFVGAGGDGGSACLALMPSSAVSCARTSSTSASAYVSATERERADADAEPLGLESDRDEQPPLATVVAARLALILDPELVLDPERVVDDRDRPPPLALVDSTVAWNPSFTRPPRDRARRRVDATRARDPTLREARARPFADSFADSLASVPASIPEHDDTSPSLSSPSFARDEHEDTSLSLSSGRRRLPRRRSRRVVDLVEGAGGGSGGATDARRGCAPRSGSSSRASRRFDPADGTTIAIPIRSRRASTRASSSASGDGGETIVWATARASSSGVGRDWGRDRERDRDRVVAAREGIIRVEDVRARTSPRASASE